jgi:hypothetical protein
MRVVLTGASGNSGPSLLVAAAALTPPRREDEVSRAAGREPGPIERNRETAVAAAQAVYYLGTGFWPLLHRRSFERVTGPKVDFWLVEAVGLTVAAIGLGLSRAVGGGGPVPRELRAVAVAAAAGLGAVDTVYVARRRISPVYLLDAAIEAAFLWDWLRLGERRRGYPASMERTPDTPTGDQERREREQESRDEPDTKYEQQREDERAERDRLADEIAGSEPGES